MFTKNQKYTNFKRLRTKLLVAAVILVLFIAVILTYRQLNHFRFPGEFEQQQAIWMQWPSGIYDQNSRPVSPVIANIVESFAPYIRVNLMVESMGELVSLKKRFQTANPSGKNVHYYLIDHRSIWARDVGPIFIKNGWGHLQVVDFGFNNYSRLGNSEYINIESQVDRRTAKQLGLPVVRAKLISEGGAIESNGRGTLMVTASVVLKRNPELRKQQIEQEYKRVLGIKKVIWLNKGLAEDDGITSGHINEIARFTGPDTILLARILPGDRDTNGYSRESYRRLEENFHILQNSTDQNGKHFRIIRIPMPPGLYAEVEPDGSLPVRSYLNYAVTNQAVLIQVYWRPGRPELLRTTEANVRKLFQKIFPGRKIIGIDAENVNRWGGGIHCITQHMPAT